MFSFLTLSNYFDHSVYFHTGWKKYDNNIIKLEQQRRRVLFMRKS